MASPTSATYENQALLAYAWFTLVVRIGDFHCLWSLPYALSVRKEYNRSPMNYDQCEPDFSVVADVGENEVLYLNI
jgi:hypothetical protein